MDSTTDGKSCLTCWELLCLSDPGIMQDFLRQQMIENPATIPRIINYVHVIFLACGFEACDSEFRHQLDRYIATPKCGL